MQLIKTNGLRVLALSCLVFSMQTHGADHIEGRWSRVFDWPLIAIHSVLTPQGNVLSFGSDETGIRSSQILYDVWNPRAGALSASHSTLSSTLGVDSFCSAAIVMPENGNILMSGGEMRATGNVIQGVTNSPVFNTLQGTLSEAANMSFPRWYPTSTLLANGEILVTGGRDNQGNPAVTPEIYSPETNQWRSLFGALTTWNHYWYPKQWVIPDGRIFGIALAKMYYIDTLGNGNLLRAGTLIGDSRGHSATAAMYLPGKILHVGGHKGTATNGAVTIDVTSSEPIVTSVARPDQLGRVWANSVILPDGKVLLVGGSEVSNELIGVASKPEIWDPSNKTWSTMASSPIARLYHSTAMLLQDGRVLVAGGGAPGPLVNTNAEIFLPPYLFDSSGVATRPVINIAPSEAPYAGQVFVGYTSNANVSRVTLVKTGAVTHSFNMEQRFLELDFTNVGNGLRVTMPESANLATPGHYLMFLLNDHGVPSKGHMVRVSHTAQTEASPYPSAEADVVVSAFSTSITIDALANDSGRGMSLAEPDIWSLKGGNVSLLNNKIIYTPPPGFNGEDKVWYTFSDWLGRTNSGEITISVVDNGGYPSPIGHPDVVSTTLDTAMTIDVLANDIGYGLLLNTPNIWSLKAGKVSLVNNKLIYKPKIGFIGEDKIWYVFTDFEGRANSGEVTITITDR